MPVTDSATLTVVVNGTITQGEVWANVLHVDKENNTDMTLAEATDISDALDTLFASMDGRRADNWAINNVTVRQETSGIQFDFEKAVVGAASNPMPFDCAIVVSWSGTPNNRRTRGRTYLNGFTEGQNDNGLLASTEQGNIADEWQTFANDLNTAGYHLSVWSNMDDASNKVSLLRVGRKWDTQRRRDNAIAETYVSRTVTIS